MVNPLNIIFVKRNMYVSIRLAASNRHSHQKKLKMLITSSWPLACLCTTVLFSQVNFSSNVQHECNTGLH